MTLSKERLGKFTGSTITSLFVGGKGKTRDSYIQSKAEEMVLGHVKNFSHRNFDHGHMNEFEAIETFGQVTGFNVEYLEQEYFPINDNCGSTPDAKVVDFSGKILASCDVKCPTSKFFEQKLQIIMDSKPEYQNSPKEYFYQAQMQMMSLGVDKHYLVRYLTKMDMDYEGNKIEYDLPVDVRLFYKVIEADPKVQQSILDAVEVASKERDLIIEMLLKPILP